MQNTEHPINIVTRKANGAFAADRLFGSFAGGGGDVTPSTAGGAADCVVRYKCGDNESASCQVFDGSDSLMVTTGGSGSKGDRIASDAAHKAVVATGTAKVLGVAEHDFTSGIALTIRPYAAPHVAAEGVIPGAAAETHNDTGRRRSPGVFATWANPTGLGRYAQAILNPSVVSTGAATIDIGSAADAVTSSDNLFDAHNCAASIAVNTTSGVGTNGKPWALVPIGGSITVAEASGDVDGFVGVLTILYFPVPV